MPTPLRISFRELQPTTALESRIRDHLMRLERFHPPILDCHVILDASSPLSTKEAAAEVTINLKVPGCEISIHRAPTEMQEDVYIVLRDAFDAAKRLLRDHARECECRGSHIDSDQQVQLLRGLSYAAPRAGS